jgi:hypothetical protein
MALSNEERRAVVQQLDVMDEVVRRVVLSTLNALADWLMAKLPEIFAKIHDTLLDVWSWIRRNFGF